MRSRGSAAIAEPATWLVLYGVLYTAMFLAVQHLTAAALGDMGRTGDEAAHFVSSAMIRDYVASGLGESPMAFALDYYAHLPRVSIGHWPPLFHLAQAGVFLVAGTSFASALGFQALVAGVAAALAATVVGLSLGGEHRGVLLGFAAGACVAASPDLLRNVGTAMPDTFLGVLVLLAAIAWAGYARSGRTAWAIGFAACAAAATLTKGNALGLGLMPPIYMALRGEFRLLGRWRTWLAGALVLAVAVPWYAATYRISSDGFVYGWGLDYTARAVPAFSGAAWRAFGPILLIGFGIGLAAHMRRARRGQPDELVLACAAAALALFLFHAVAPADIQSRYLIAILPCIVVVGVLGLAGLPVPGRAGTAAVLAGLAANLALTLQVPRPSPAMMNGAAQSILAAADPAPLVLVGAGPNGEGAAIAAFAAFDPARRHYVVRASKAFASSNFMGSRYQPRFATAAGVKDWITGHRIGWLVLEDGPDSLAMEHDRQLAELAEARDDGWRLVFERSGANRRVRVFRLAGPPAMASEIDRVVRQVAPTKLIGGGPG